MRTCPDLGEKLNLSHMTLGMFSEFYELNIGFEELNYVNISEEIADMFWYLSNYCNFRDIQLTNDFKVVDFSDMALLTYLSTLQDYVKKYITYDKPINREKELMAINYIKNSLYTLALELGTDIPTALENNINKLLIRFPNGFNNNDAVNRNLEKEFETLKNNIDGATNNNTESN